MFVIASDRYQMQYAQFMTRQLKGFPTLWVGIGWTPPQGSYLTTTVAAPTLGASWCAKPNAILAGLSLTPKVIWLDNDIEIVDMYNFKKIWNEKPVAAAWDGRAENYNTGVMVWDRIDKAREWANYCQLGAPDQDALWGLEQKDKFIKPLDGRYNSLRLAPTPNAYANHHTGPTGKQELVETDTWKKFMKS